jgi:MGT family glycosyltransferase
MTLGTVLNTDTSIFRAVLEGLADAPVNLIVTVGSANDPAALGDPPANAHVERYIPQSLLFPLCSVVISHAGSGTTLAALAHGLPQLLIPQGADQFVNADRCLEAGVGSRLLPDQVSPDAVRSSLNALLGDDGYRRAAARLQAEIERMPSPEEWIGPLHSLTEAVAR